MFQSIHGTSPISRSSFALGGFGTRRVRLTNRQCSAVRKVFNSIQNRSPLRMGCGNSKMSQASCNKGSSWLLHTLVPNARVAIGLRMLPWLWQIRHAWVSQGAEQEVLELKDVDSGLSTKQGTQEAKVWQSNAFRTEPQSAICDCGGFIGLLNAARWICIGRRAEHPFDWNGVSPRGVSGVWNLPLVMAITTVRLGCCFPFGCSRSRIMRGCWRSPPACSCAAAANNRSFCRMSMATPWQNLGNGSVKQCLPSTSFAHRNAKRCYIFRTMGANRVLLTIVKCTPVVHLFRLSSIWEWLTAGLSNARTCVFLSVVAPVIWDTRYETELDQTQQLLGRAVGGTSRVARALLDSPLAMTQNLRSHCGAGGESEIRKEWMRGLAPASLQIFQNRLAHSCSKTIDCVGSGSGYIYSGFKRHWHWFRKTLLTVSRRPSK